MYTSQRGAKKWRPRSLTAGTNVGARVEGAYTGGRDDGATVGALGATDGGALGPEGAAVGAPVAGTRPVTARTRNASAM